MFRVLTSFRSPIHRRIGPWLLLAALTLLTLGAPPDLARGGTQKGNTAPAITSFLATEGPGHLWSFSGTVTDGNTNPNPIVVTLGGLPSIQGKTTTVDPTSGAFSITIQLQIGENGTATAQATDALGAVSNLAMALVQGN
jgi:hypothetical protein